MALSYSFECPLASVSVAVKTRKGLCCSVRKSDLESVLPLHLLAFSDTSVVEYCDAEIIGLMVRSQHHVHVDFIAGLQYIW